MERYFMEPSRNRGDLSYDVFDRRRGYGAGYDVVGNRLATVYDPDIAARIVRLLNADAAATEKQIEGGAA